MTLNQTQLEELLSPRPVKFYPQVESTQNIAMAWLADRTESGAVVIADEQTAGRGRYGRKWHTPPGVAIAISIILYPPVEALPQITMLGAVAIAELLRGLGVEDVRIKWPNDVRLSGKKVCGVLPEAVWDGDELRGVSLGLGINIRNDFSGTEFEDTATTIESALNRQVDRAGLIKILLDRIDYWMDHLGTDSLYNTWKSQLSIIGEQVNIGSDGGIVSGIVEDVDSDGALLVRDSKGELQRVLAGDIALGGD